MSIFTLVIAFILALFFTAVFSFVFKNRGPWGSIWSFFLILFLAVWAGGLWIAPVGPFWRDVALVPLLVIGLLFAILLAASAPDRVENKIMKEPPEAGSPEEGTKAVAAIGVFFWILLIVLLAIVITGLV